MSQSAMLVSLRCRQSLVTPIDWKQAYRNLVLEVWFPVSPILGDAY